MAPKRTPTAYLKKQQFLRADQSGMVLIYAVIFLVVIGGFCTLVIDYGHMLAVKGQLENAADAGALAGCGALNTAPFPNWINAQNTATAVVQENRVDGRLITDCQVQAGYWHLSWNSSTAPPDLKPQGTSPGPLDVPAVKVTISRSPGQNGGPLLMMFATLFGTTSSVVSANSVAVLVPQNPVTAIPAGAAFPLATPISFVQQYYDSDPPVSFRIGSDYHSPDGGQWTSFLTDANNVPTIRDLIDNGNPDPLKVGDEIWIEPGTKTTLYGEAASRIGQIVLLPVVSDDFDTHAKTKLLAFAPFYIEDSVGGSGKYIQGHFVNNYQVPATHGSPAAHNFGALANSIKLVSGKAF